MLFNISLKILNSAQLRCFSV